MSSLTEQERRGLEEVFLSISSTDDHVDRFKSIKRSVARISAIKIFGASRKHPVYRAVASIGRIRVPKLSSFLKVRRGKK